MQEHLDILDILKKFNPESSVLFLGSGFSLDAVNISEGNPPNGSGLIKHFRKLFKDIHPETSSRDFSLKLLSEELFHKDSSKLYDELYNLFRIKELSDSQKIILNESWRCIYTTNYDDSVELHRINNKKSPDSFDILDEIQNKIPKGSVIHLHGSLKNLDKYNAIDSIVLTESSYLNKELIHSPWYGQFERDITYADAIFFIGYSLSDYHIADILMENPKITQKTFFIQGPNRDQFLEKYTNKFGRTLFIGTKAFAEALQKAERPAQPDISSLQAFRSLTPIRDQHTGSQPTAPEIFELLVYGTFNAKRLARSQPSDDYAIARREKIEKAVSIIERYKTLLVDSRLGNGKSIFLHLLAFEMSKRAYRCFLLRPEHPDLEKEMEILSSIENAIIFVEQYSAAQDALGILQKYLPEAKFVVELRTSTYEVRYHELLKIIPQTFSRLDINPLSPCEKKALKELGDKAGLNIKDTPRSSELRDILLDTFENKVVCERIKTILDPLLKEPITCHILTITMLITKHQGSVSASFLRSIINKDPFSILNKFPSISNEIFEMSSERFKARSAILSSFVIEKFIESDLIIDSVIKIARAAAKRSSNRSYRILMSNIITYSKLSDTLSKKGNYKTMITDIYEDLRGDTCINNEPLFWLQYAIAMTEASKLALANEYISTAYRRAKKRLGFQTYQIDTQAFRIYLLSATEESSGQDISNIFSIIEKFELINDMLIEESKRTYAVRVLEHVTPFIEARLDDLKKYGHTTQIFFHLRKIEKSLSSLPTDFRVRTGSDKIRQNITKCVAYFQNTNTTTPNLPL